MHFKDRKPTRPNRYKVTPENGGTPYYVTLERADEPSEVGTALNAEVMNRFLTVDFDMKDYNGDGVINAADVTEFAARVKSGNVNLEDDDYNNDGVVDTLDVKLYERLMLRFGDVVEEVSNHYGRYMMPDGVLIQWGSVTITPTAIDEPTGAIVTFPVPYINTPLVYTQAMSSVPHNVAIGVMRSTVEDPNKEVEIILTRAGTTSTVISWLAIGKGA
jgi:hypothetical protein